MEAYRSRAQKVKVSNSNKYVKNWQNYLKFRRDHISIKRSQSSLKHMALEERYFCFLYMYSNVLLGNQILKFLTQFLFTPHSDKTLMKFSQDLAPPC